MSAHANKKLPLFLMIITMFGLLALAVYHSLYGSPALVSNDSLNAEELFDDLFFKGGSLAQWALPHASYWLDFILYCAIRALSTNVHTASAVFASAMAITLAGAACFAAWPFAETTARKYTTITASCLIALFLCTHSSSGFIMSRVLFHVTTAGLACLSVGCLIRILLFSPKYWVHVLLLLSITVASASDTMFVLWFIIPASFLVGVLTLTGRIPFSRAIKLMILLALPVLMGKGLDALLKPNESGNLIRPSMKNFFPTLKSIGLIVKALFFSSKLSMVYGILGVSVFAAAFRNKNNKIYLLLLIFIVVLTICGYAYVGKTPFWYLPPLCSIFLLLSLSFGVAQLPAPLSGVLCAILIAAQSGTLMSQSGVYKEPYRPTYASCVTDTAARNGISNILASWSYSRPLQYLSGASLSVTPIRVDYHFLFSDNVTTSHNKHSTANMLVLPRNHPQEMFSIDTVYAINGTPERVIECPGNVSLHIYPQGARLATMRDYLLDKEGRFEKSFPERDMELWKGSQKISGTALNSVASLYRLNRQWIVFHLDSKPEALFGKTLSIYMTGNKDKYLRRLAGAKLSQDGTSALDYLWKKLAWSKTFTLDAENTLDAPNGEVIPPEKSSVYK